jgi:hypothetical protein
MRKTSISIAVLAGLALPMCSDADRPPVNDADAGALGDVVPKVQAVVEPFAFTSVLSAQAGALLTAVDDDAMTLSFEGASAELDALAEDRIVILPASELAPHGLLRRIDAVERTGQRVVLTTRETSLLYAFRKVDVTVDAAGPAQAATLPTLPTLATALSVDSAGKYPFKHDIDWVVFDGDKSDQTTEDRVLVSGQLEAAVGYTFHMEFDWGALSDIIDCLEDPDLSCLEGLNPLEIAGDVGFELSLINDLSAGADLRVSGASALSFEREIELGEPLYLPLIEAGPILLRPRLAASAGVEGGATAKLDVELEVSGGAEFGLKAKGTSVTPVGKGPYLDTPSGSATIQAAAQVRAWVNPRVELLLYGVVGPTVGLEPAVVVRADTEQDPCWHLEGALAATLGIHLGVGPVTLIDEQRSVPIESSEFASGECALPGGPGGGSLDPTFEPWASATAGSLYSSGSLDDSTALAPTHDGNYLFTASTSTGLLKLDAQGEPLWIREYVRDQLETLYPARAVSLLDASLLLIGRRGAVLRTNELGELLDARVLDIADDANTHIGAAVRSADGGAWVAGDTPLAAGGADGWFARFAPDGSLIDAFAIRGPYDERPKAIVLLGDGGALLAGESFDAGRTYAWAARVAKDGSAQWFVRLVDCATEGGLGEDELAVRAATLTQDGNFALAGYTFYPDYRGMLVKLWKDGTLAWGQTYAAELGLGLQLESVASLESGGFLLGGTQVDVGPNDALALAETDSAGNVAWMQRYDGPGRDGHVSLWRTPADNGVLIGATAEGFFDSTDAAASAFVLKVPRKSGELSFAASSGATLSSVVVSDAGVCIAVEPYAAGVIEPQPAELLPLPAVVDRAATLEHRAL